MHDGIIPHFINESFDVDHVTGEQMDVLLSDGWRNFGTNFFRHNLSIHNDEIEKILPLRIRLNGFTISKSQRRTVRANADLAVVFRPIEITAEAERIFRAHRLRFEMGIPDSLYVFLSSQPATVPSEAQECAIYLNDDLVAVSYFNSGIRSTSGIYGMFDPEHSHRRLGIFTMLKEIEYSIDSGYEFYYPGYAYEGESFYDYKKRFAGLEYYDWEGNWLPLARA